MTTTGTPLLYEALNFGVLNRIPASARRVLDLGCGTGNLAAALKERGAQEIVGVTFSESEAKQAAGKVDRVLVDNLDTFVPPADFGRFDAVICSHILEHLTQPHRLLRLVQNLMNPGAALIVALPNVLHWKNRLRLFGGDFKYTDGGIMDTTHARFYDWDTARALITECGFVLSAAYAEGNFPLPLVRRLLPRSLADGIDHWGTDTFPGLFGAQFVLVAQAPGK